MGSVTDQPNWLAWARGIQAIAQTGLHYAEGVYDRERYAQLGEIAAGMLAALAGMDPPAMADVLREERGYATPKVDVRGACFRQGNILMVRERLDGLWTLPGGWADVADTPSQAVEREIREESGFEARAVKLAAVYHRDHPRHGHTPYLFSTYKLFFLCEIEGGGPQTSVETDAVEFFAGDRLPPLAVGKVTESQIRRLFAHQRNPDWPTEFD